MYALTFVIEAPLASWGSRLSGTIRTSDALPTHSALMGMIGAALGIPRKDDSLTQLAADYACAVWVVSAGQRMSDFHTVETPIETGFIYSRPRTREDELAGSTTTTITRREYMMDVRYVIALVPVADKPNITLAQVEEAINMPVFTLCAGRRSCSLSSPVTPIRLSKDDFDHFLQLATVWDARITSADQGHSIRQRTDMPLSASKRRFTVRDEVMR